MQQYEREFAQWEPEERKVTMTLISSWEQRGIEKGREQILEVILRHRFNALPPDLTDRLDRLTSDQMDELAKALFSFKDIDDLEQWLSQHLKPA